MQPDNATLYDLITKLGDRLEQKIDDFVFTHQEFAQKVVADTTELQTQMYQLIGNGQPGRVGKLEATVEILKKFRYTVLAYASAASLTLSAVWALVAHLTKH